MDIADWARKKCLPRLTSFQEIVIIETLQILQLLFARIIKIIILNPTLYGLNRQY